MAGRKQRPRGRKVASPAASAPSRVRRPLLKLVAPFCLGALVTAAALLLIQGRGNEQSSGAPNLSLAQVLGLNAKAVQGLDIAEMNLLCATGLPGAENLDLGKSLSTLDRWADRVRHETKRHLYRMTDPHYAEHYRNSDAYFRASMLLQVLQEDCGVHYNKERIRDIDFTNSRDLFIHGMVTSDNGGTCVSMPVLYVAVGRRLGYPMFLVLAKAHVFTRWDDPERGERFSIEGAGDGFSSFPDDYYKTWPMKLTDADLATGHYLKSLTPAEELAVFLAARGHCLEDTGCLPEARLAYAQAHRLDPKSAEYLGFLAHVTGGGFGRTHLVGPRRPAPRDPLAELRRIKAINEYNRRLMERYTPTPTPVPGVHGVPNPNRPAYVGPPHSPP